MHITTRLRHALAGLAVLTLSMLAALPCSAQELHRYRFNDLTTSAGGTSSAGTTNNNLTFSSFNAVGSFTGNTKLAGALAFSGWTVGGTGPDLDRYYSFTVTPDDGYAMDLSMITFGTRVTGGTVPGPNRYSVRSSLDGFASNLTAGLTHPNANISLLDGNAFQLNNTTALQAGSYVSLTSVFLGLTEPVEFRIYAWNAASSSSLAYFAVDDVTVIGSVSAAPVPEPAAFATMLGLAALAGASIRRRRLAA